MKFDMYNSLVLAAVVTISGVISSPVNIGRDVDTTLKLGQQNCECRAPRRQHVPGVPEKLKCISIKRLFLLERRTFSVSSLLNEWI